MVTNFQQTLYLMPRRFVGQQLLHPFKQIHQQNGFFFTALCQPFSPQSSEFFTHFQPFSIIFRTFETNHHFSAISPKPLKKHWLSLRHGSLFLTRYTVHGRGAKHGSVEHIISVWIHSRPVSNGDSFQSVFSRMPSLSHPKNHFWAPFSSWRHQRQFKTVRFLHPLPKVKVTGHFLHFFPKMPLFFVQKRVPEPACPSR